MSSTIEIAGKQFKAITNSTMRHDIWVQGQLERANLTRLALEPGESPEEFAMRVLRQAAINSDIFLLLGGLLMPAAVDPLSWSPVMAQKTADFLGGVTEPVDKQIVQMQINSALTSFFITGLSSLTTSLRSSQQTGGRPSSETGDVLTTRNGDRSSENLQAATTTEPKRS